VRRISGISLVMVLLLVGGLVAWLLSDAGPRAEKAAEILHPSESAAALPAGAPTDAASDVQALLAASAPEGLAHATAADAPRVPESYRRALGGLTGRVLTSDQQPVPNLPVELLGGRRSLIIRSASAFLQEGGLDFDPVVGRAVTGADGRFQLADLQPRTVGVLVLDPGGPRALLWPLEVSPVSGETRDLGDIVLPARATLRGRIADEHDQPIAGARVRATEAEQVSFVPDIAHFREGGGVAVVEQGGDKEFAWVPPPAMSALVSKLPVPTTTSAADGSFELAGVLPGLVTVAVDEPSHLVLMQAGVPTGAAGGTKDLGTLVLGSGETVKGRVLDGAGKPVAGAEVLLGNTLGVVPAAVLRGPYHTAADGSFSAAGFRPGAVWGIARPDAQHEWTIATDLDTGRDNALHLMASRTLTLAVLDKDGVAVPDVALFGRAVPDGDFVDLLVAPHTLADVTRDAQGRYVVAGLKPAAWEIVAKAPGRPQERASFDLTTADATGEVRLKPGRALPVRVVDPAGAPVEWATLEVAAKEPSFEDAPLAVARTGEDGRALLTDLPAGPLWVSATHPAWAVAQEKADLSLPAGTPPEKAPPPDELLITLQAGGRLVGKVIDGSGPPPEPLLAILVPDEDREATDSLLPRLCITDLQGAFAFDHVEAGQVHVEVRSRENLTGGLSLFEAFFDSPLAEEQVTVEAQGETSVLLDVGAQYAGKETAMVSGRLLVNGMPADGWKIRSWSGIRRTVSTDPRGQFDLGRLEAGKVELTFSAPDSRLMEGFADRQEFELQAGERRVLEIALSTGSLGGRVVSAVTGRPLASANVQALAEGEGGWGRSTSTATEADGRFHLEPVAAGKYRIRVRAEGHANFTSELVEVGELQGPDDLLLRVPAALHVKGTIRFEDSPKAPKWMWLVASAADGHTRDTSRVEGDDHKFAFDGLAPGEWTFTLATDEDDEFEEVKLNVDSDLAGVALSFKRKPPQPTPEGDTPFQYELK
jgi:protocatechuate 3,4-dioxygenase beta subunit